MKILYFAAIFAFTYTVAHCKPSKADLEDIYGPLAEEDMQNDDQDYDGDGDYEDEKAEEDNLESDSEPPHINTTGEEFTRKVNESVRLPCVITGKNVVQLWRKGGQILFQDGSRMAASPNMNALVDGSLEITKVQKEDAGDYVCVVMISMKKNPEIIHHLNVLAPAHSVHITPKDNITALKVNETLTLKCQASGNPKPKISWHKGSERLGTVGDTLVIEKVKHHNAGWYRCLADNGIGEPAHASIEIHVETKPVVILEKLTVSSENNYDTELKCTVHAYPKAQVNWKKDDRNIINSDHTMMKTEKNHHILIIKGVKESDFGTYTCMAVNYVGETERRIKLVKTPVVLGFFKPESDTKDVVLTWEVQSKTAISEHELEFKKEGERKWKMVKPEVNKPIDEIYTVKYTLNGLEPGRYETRLRSQNSNGWSEYSETQPFEGVAKHGHHNKKGRKDSAKEKHNTQEVTTPNIPIVNEIPAEHQESEKHSGLVKDTPHAGASESSSSRSTTAASLIISIAFIVLLQIRQ